jgi:hypothetical protein
MVIGGRHGWLVLEEEVVVVALGVVQGFVVNPELLDSYVALP